MPTAIEWCDETWNPVTGCTKVSAGCKYCYAERLTERFGQQKFTDIVLHPERLDQPLRWKRPRRIFVNSMSDLFHEEIPQEFIAQVFEVMFQAEHHVFQVLTKRPERMQVMMDSWDKLFAPARHIWLGVSVENQEQADKRIPLLLQTPAAVRFLSVEPLLGPVDLSGVFHRIRSRQHTFAEDPFQERIHWVIVGGESGGPPERALVNGIKSSHVWDQGKMKYGPKYEALKWVRSLRDQCVAAGVPFFFKQWGGVTPKSGGRLLDGREWNEYPEARVAKPDR